MKKNLAKLIDLKSIITILMVGTLVYGFCAGKINTSEFIPLVTMILTFYFAKKDNNNSNKEES